LLGQYIIKNFVLISAGIVLGAALNDRPPVKNVRKAGNAKIAQPASIAKAFEEECV